MNHSGSRPTQLFGILGCARERAPKLPHGVYHPEFIGLPARTVVV